MDTLRFRADLLTLDEVTKEFVESDLDKLAISSILNPMPLLLEGSRGSGKTMLLRKAHSIMKKEFEVKRNLPVYVSFSTTMLVDEKYFTNWMISKILFGIKESLRDHLNLVSEDKTKLFEDLFGLPNSEKVTNPYFNALEKIISVFEKSNYEDITTIYQEISEQLPRDISETPLFNETDVLIEFTRRICSEFDISRIYLLIDEASHNFLHKQQRTFFEFFRNLTCEYLVLNAAVYPGITSYGETFQPSHDADVFSLNRKITEENYVLFMRNMLEKKLGVENYNRLLKNGELLDVMIYAASGNPRTLIKSLSNVTDAYSKPLKRNKINSLIKDYFITEIWSEHEELMKKYLGHSKLIKWGREFIDENVISGIVSRNQNKDEKGNFFAIDKENSRVIHHAFKILEYSGIVSKDNDTVKKYMNNKNRIFTRYQLNLGIIVATQTNPIDSCMEIIKGLSSKNCYWITSFADNPLDEINLDEDNAGKIAINVILNTEANRLDLSVFLKDKVDELGCITIADVLSKDRDFFKSAHYVGDYRANKIYDEARAAILEYISG